MFVGSIEPVLVALGIIYFAISWHDIGKWLLLLPDIFAAFVVAGVSIMIWGLAGYPLAHWRILAVRYGASLGTHCGTL